METRGHLTLVAESSEESIGFDAPAVHLCLQPQRPGELTELLDVPVGAVVLERLEQETQVPLPLELALYITIEAERSFREAADLFDIEAGELADELDHAASVDCSRSVSHMLARPLERYAAALATGIEQQATSGDVVYVRAPHHVAAGWASSAAARGVALDAWLVEVLERASGARAPWEAAAARTGRTLSEWVLVQAARAARSRRTLPHTTAST